jgi:hypothetical protein
MQNEVIEVLREMAWQRAKAELNCILGTYFPTYEGNKIITEDYDTMKNIINDFIVKVEENL